MHRALLTAGSVRAMPRLPLGVRGLAAVGAVLATRALARRVGAGSGQQQRQDAPAAASLSAPELVLAPAAAASPSAKHAPWARLAARSTLGPLLSLVLASLSSTTRSLWLGVTVGASLLSAWLLDVVPQLPLAADAQAERPAIDPASVERFCGSWTKVAARSEPMSGFCDLFGVPRFLRSATRLMGGVELAVDRAAGVLVVKQVCKLSWLSTVETFPLDGSPSAPQRRRDMRSGKQTGQLLAAADGRVQVCVAWGAPLAGSATDTLVLAPDGGELRVTHEAAVEGRGAAAFTEVFSRRPGSGGGSAGGGSG